MDQNHQYNLPLPIPFPDSLGLSNNNINAKNNGTNAIPVLANFNFDTYSTLKPSLSSDIPHLNTPNSVHDINEPIKLYDNSNLDSILDNFPKGSELPEIIDFIEKKLKIKITLNTFQFYLKQQGITIKTPSSTTLVDGGLVVNDGGVEHYVLERERVFFEIINHSTIITIIHQLFTRLMTSHQLISNIDDLYLILKDSYDGELGGTLYRYPILPQYDSTNPTTLSRSPQTNTTTHSNRQTLLSHQHTHLQQVGSLQQSIFTITAGPQQLNNALNSPNNLFNDPLLPNTHHPFNDTTISNNNSTGINPINPSNLTPTHHPNVQSSFPLSPPYPHQLTLYYYPPTVTTQLDPMKTSINMIHTIYSYNLINRDSTTLGAGQIILDRFSALKSLNHFKSLENINRSIWLHNNAGLYLNEDLDGDRNNDNFCPNQQQSTFQPQQSTSSKLQFPSMTTTQSSNYGTTNPRKRGIAALYNDDRSVYNTAHQLSHSIFHNITHNNNTVNPPGDSDQKNMTSSFQTAFSGYGNGGSRSKDEKNTINNHITYHQNNNNHNVINNTHFNNGIFSPISAAIDYATLIPGNLMCLSSTTNSNLTNPLLDSPVKTATNRPNQAQFSSSTTPYPFTPTRIVKIDERDGYNNDGVVNNSKITPNIDKTLTRLSSSATKSSHTTLSGSGNKTNNGILGGSGMKGSNGDVSTSHLLKNPQNLLQSFVKQGQSTSSQGHSLIDDINNELDSEMNNDVGFSNFNIAKNNNKNGQNNTNIPNILATMNQQAAQSKFKQVPRLSRITSMDYEMNGAAIVKAGGITRLHNNENIGKNVKNAEKSSKGAKNCEKMTENDTKLTTKSPTKRTPTKLPKNNILSHINPRDDTPIDLTGDGNGNGGDENKEDIVINEETNNNLDNNNIIQATNNNINSINSPNYPILSSSPKHPYSTRRNTRVEVPQEHENLDDRDNNVHKTKKDTMKQLNNRLYHNIASQILSQSTNIVQSQLHHVLNKEPQQAHGNNGHIDENNNDINDSTYLSRFNTHADGYNGRKVGGTKILFDQNGRVMGVDQGVVLDENTLVHLSSSDIAQNTDQIKYSTQGDMIRDNYTQHASSQVDVVNLHQGKRGKNAKRGRGLNFDYFENHTQNINNSQLDFTQADMSFSQHNNAYNTQSDQNMVDFTQNDYIVSQNKSQNNYNNKKQHETNYYNNDDNNNDDDDSDDDDDDVDLYRSKMHKMYRPASPAMSVAAMKFRPSICAALSVITTHTNNASHSNNNAHQSHDINNMSHLNNDNSNATLPNNDSSHQNNYNHTSLNSSTLINMAPPLDDAIPSTPPRRSSRSLNKSTLGITQESHSKGEKGKRSIHNNNNILDSETTTKSTNNNVTTITPSSSTTITKTLSLSSNDNIDLKSGVVDHNAQNENGRVDFDLLVCTTPCQNGSAQNESEKEALSCFVCETPEILQQPPLTTPIIEQLRQMILEQEKQALVDAADDIEEQFNQTRWNDPKSMMQFLLAFTTTESSKKLKNLKNLNIFGSFSKRKSTTSSSTTPSKPFSQSLKQQSQNNMSDIAMSQIAGSQMTSSQCDLGSFLNNFPDEAKLDGVRYNDETLSLGSVLNDNDQKRYYGMVRGKKCRLYDVFDFTQNTLLVKKQKANPNNSTSVKTSSNSTLDRESNNTTHKDDRIINFGQLLSQYRDKNVDNEGLLNLVKEINTPLPFYCYGLDTISTPIHFPFPSYQCSKLRPTSRPLWAAEDDGAVGNDGSMMKKQSLYFTPVSIPPPSSPTFTPTSLNIEINDPYYGLLLDNLDNKSSHGVHCLPPGLNCGIVNNSIVDVITQTMSLYSSSFSDNNSSLSSPSFHHNIATSPKHPNNSLHTQSTPFTVVNTPQSMVNGINNESGSRIDLNSNSTSHNHHNPSLPYTLPTSTLHTTASNIAQVGDYRVAAPYTIQTGTIQQVNNKIQAKTKENHHKNEKMNEKIKNDTNNITNINANPVKLDRTFSLTNHHVKQSANTMNDASVCSVDSQSLPSMIDGSFANRQNANSNSHNQFSNVQNGQLTLNGSNGGQYMSTQTQTNDLFERMGRFNINTQNHTQQAMAQYDQRYSPQNRFLRNGKPRQDDKLVAQSDDLANGITTDIDSPQIWLFNLLSFIKSMILQSSLSPVKLSLPTVNLAAVKAFLMLKQSSFPTHLPPPNPFITSLPQYGNSSDHLSNSNKSHDNRYSAVPAVLQQFMLIIGQFQSLLTKNEKNIISLTQNYYRKYPLNLTIPNPNHDQDIYSQSHIPLDIQVHSIHDVMDLYYATNNFVDFIDLAVVRRSLVIARDTLLHDNYVHHVNKNNDIGTGEDVSGSSSVISPQTLEQLLDCTTAMEQAMSSVYAQQVILYGKQRPEGSQIANIDLNEMMVDIGKLNLFLNCYDEKMADKMTKNDQNLLQNPLPSLPLYTGFKIPPESYNIRDTTLYGNGLSPGSQGNQGSTPKWTQNTQNTQKSDKNDKNGAGSSPTGLATPPRTPLRRSARNHKGSGASQIAHMDNMMLDEFNNDNNNESFGMNDGKDKGKISCSEQNNGNNKNSSTSFVKYNNQNNLYTNIVFGPNHSIEFPYVSTGSKIRVIHKTPSPGKKGGRLSKKNSPHQSVKVTHLIDDNGDDDDEEENNIPQIIQTPNPRKITKYNPHDDDGTVRATNMLHQSVKKKLEKGESYSNFDHFVNSTNDKNKNITLSPHKSPTTSVTHHAILNTPAPKKNNVAVFNQGSTFNLLNTITSFAKEQSMTVPTNHQITSAHQNTTSTHQTTITNNNPTNTTPSHSTILTSPDNTANIPQSNHLDNTPYKVSSRLHATSAWFQPFTHHPSFINKPTSFSFPFPTSTTSFNSITGVGFDGQSAVLISPEDNSDGDAKGRGGFLCPTQAFDVFQFKTTAHFVPFLLPYLIPLNPDPQKQTANSYPHNYYENVVVNQSTGQIDFEKTIEKELLNSKKQTVLTKQNQNNPQTQQNYPNTTRKFPYIGYTTLTQGLQKTQQYDKYSLSKNVREEHLEKVIRAQLSSFLDLSSLPLPSPLLLHRANARRSVYWSITERSTAMVKQNIGVKGLVDIMKNDFKDQFLFTKSFQAEDGSNTMKFDRKSSENDDGDDESADQEDEDVIEEYKTRHFLKQSTFMNITPSKQHVINRMQSPLVSNHRGDATECHSISKTNPFQPTPTQAKPTQPSPNTQTTYLQRKQLNPHAISYPEVPPRLLAHCSTLSHYNTSTPKRHVSLSTILETSKIPPTHIEFYWKRFSRIFFDPNTPYTSRVGIESLYLAMYIFLRFLGQVALITPQNGITIERLIIVSLYTASLQYAHNFALPLHILCNHSFHKENRPLILKKFLHFKPLAQMPTVIVQHILKRSLPQLINANIPALGIPTLFISEVEDVEDCIQIEFDEDIHAHTKTQIITDAQKTVIHTKSVRTLINPFSTSPSTYIQAPDITLLVEIFQQYLSFTTRTFTPYDFFTLYLPHSDLDLTGQFLGSFLLELSLSQPFFSDYPPNLTASAVICLCRYIALSQHYRANDYAVLYYLQNKHYGIVDSTTSDEKKEQNDPSQTQNPFSSLTTPFHTTISSQPMYKAFIPFSTPEEDTTINALFLAWPHFLTQITGTSLHSLLPLIQSLTHLLIIALHYHYNASSSPYTSFLPQVYVPQLSGYPQLVAPVELSTGLSTMTLFKGHCIAANIAPVEGIYGNVVPLPMDIIKLNDTVNHNSINNPQINIETNSVSLNENASICSEVTTSDSIHPKACGFDTIPVPFQHSLHIKTNTSLERPLLSAIPPSLLTNSIQIYPVESAGDVNQEGHRDSAKSFIPHPSIQRYLTTHYPATFTRCTHDQSTQIINSDGNSVDMTFLNEKSSSVQTKMKYPYIQVGQYLVPFGPNAPNLGYSDPTSIKYSHPEFLCVAERIVPPFDLTPAVLQKVSQLLTTPQISSQPSPLIHPSATMPYIDNINQPSFHCAEGTNIRYHYDVLTEHLITFPVTLPLPAFKKITLRHFISEKSYPSSAPIVPIQIKMTVCDDNIDQQSTVDLVIDSINSNSKGKDNIKLVNDTSLIKYTLPLSKLFPGTFDNNDTTQGDVYRRAELNRKYRIWDTKLEKWNFFHVQKRFLQRDKNGNFVLFQPWGVRSPDFDTERAERDLPKVDRDWVKGVGVHDMNNDSNNTGNSSSFDLNNTSNSNSDDGEFRPPFNTTMGDDNNEGSSGEEYYSLVPPRSLNNSSNNVNCMDHYSSINTTNQNDANISSTTIFNNNNQYNHPLLMNNNSNPFDQPPNNNLMNNSNLHQPFGFFSTASQNPTNATQHQQINNNDNNTRSKNNNGDGFVEEMMF